jgi:hypothetical protein
MERWIVMVRVCSLAVLLAACVAIGVWHGGPVGLFLILGALIAFTTGNLLITLRFGDREVRAYYATHRRPPRLRIAFRSPSAVDVPPVVTRVYVTRTDSRSEVDDAARAYTA